MWTATVVVLAHAYAAMLIAWFYFRRFSVTRPPIGVLNLGDVLFMLGAVIVMPYLYLWSPRWLAAGVLVALSFSLLVATWEPVLRRRAAVWVVSALLVGADVVTSVRGEANSAPFLAVNNIVLLLSVVGVTNLWAQSGLKARDATILGVALAVYDAVATAVLPLTDDMVERLSGLPFAPMFAWPPAHGEWLGMGLGDVLLATIFPLVMGKAFGRPAAGLAMAFAALTLTALAAVGVAGLLTGSFPTMVVLGPLMVLQYVVWSRLRGPERTTRAFLRDQAAHVSAVTV